MNKIICSHSSSLSKTEKSSPEPAPKAPRRSLKEFFLGKARDPFSIDTRHSIALAAFLAWVGLGADGLSSSAYGPEEAFRALGSHTHFGLYLAIATALTVFLIALAYNQVVELFPTGGGGYRVATSLLGPYAGLTSGAALIVDYVLTVAISVASGIDALFSLLPLSLHGYKLVSECLVVGLLIWINLRGAKESIQILLPIFLGFIITHTVLIIYGILTHAEGIPQLIPETIAETQQLATESGWIFVAALFLRAYSMGGGTYTGIEAVSNNVQQLAEPRVRTGKLTMMYMASSLAFMAGGIILLYLLWDAIPVEGKTLNAVVFGSILQDMGFSNASHTAMLILVLVFEAGLLLVAANTGFLGGPAVLANMAADSWVPHQFRYLSNRLVTQNGVLLMGISAIGILLITGGRVGLLVVLYSINVFLTFTLSLAGLVCFWIKHRKESAYSKQWRSRLALSLLGLCVTAGILIVTIIEKFFEGGWGTLGITGLLILLCLGIRKHYQSTRASIQEIDATFADQPFGSVTTPAASDPQAPTAAFIVGSSRGGGLHALLWVQRMFPGHFRNFVFISTRAVDAQAYGGKEALEQLQTEASVSLNYFVQFCRSNGMAAESYLAIGTDALDELSQLTQRVQKDFPNTVFFMSKLVFSNEHWWHRLLHNQAAMVLQRKLHLSGQQMMVLPMKL